MDQRKTLLEESTVIEDQILAQVVQVLLIELWKSHPKNVWVWIQNTHTPDSSEQKKQTGRILK